MLLVWGPHFENRCYRKTFLLKCTHTTLQKQAIIEVTFQIVIFFSVWCGNVPIFISDFSYFFSFFLSLAKVSSIFWSFQRTDFDFIDIIFLFFILFISAPIFIISFLLLSLDLVCSFSLLPWAVKLGYWFKIFLLF